MTKNEWKTIRVGTKVTKTGYYGRNSDNTALTLKTLIGTVKRINSNCSQILVLWDDDNYDMWYGRTGVELVKPQP